jgi:hypothetical protein
MAADKEIMKQIETLRLDRPGRAYRAAAGVGTLGENITQALTELAATYREEAELWSRSGAKGWKSSEAEKYLVAQHIDDVAGQLDNAGGGAALSVSESERKTAYDWNDDPRIDSFVVSWSDFGISADAQGLGIDRDALITRAEFEQARDGGAVTVGRRTPATTHERLDDLVNSAVAEGRGMLREGNDASNTLDVEAYLKGEVDTLPGLADALVPGSVTDGTVHLRRVELIDNGDGTASNANAINVTVSTGDFVLTDGDSFPIDANAEYVPPTVLDDFAAPAPPDDTQAGIEVPTTVTDAVETPVPTGPEVVARTEEIRAIGAALPTTWESKILTPDGYVKPGVAQTLAPTLGQPGDNTGGGYSHDYVPAGSRKLTYADLMTPVPVASLPPHLSHSQGSTISDCAAKYRMQRVELLPQIPQWANIGGTAFHAAVEAFERTVGGMPAERAQRANWEGYDCEITWKHHFEATIAAVAATTAVPISVWRAARRGGEGEQWWRFNGPLMLRRYLDARPDEPTITVDSTGTPAIEWEVATDIPTPYGPLPYKGVLDRVTVTRGAGEMETAVVIRDYKTSYERPTDTTQLSEYAWMLMLSGANLHGSTHILGTYFDARRGTWTEPVDLLAAHPFEAFQYNVTSRHAQKLALTTGPTPARPSSFCGGCSVRYACPVQRPPVVRG